MKPYAMDGDFAVSTRLFFGAREGDVLVFRDPTDQRLLIKRVTRVESGKGEKKYFMEGDNRMRSTDSRVFGSIGKRDVFAKVIFIAKRSKGERTRGGND